MNARTNGTLPHLLIDGRPLTGVRNGVTRVLEQLLKVWPDVPRFRTTLISNRPISSNAVLPAAVDCYVDDGMWSRVPGSIWMSLRTNAIARQLGATHFLGTQHVLPIWGARQLRTGLIVHDLVFDKFPETMQTSNRLMSQYFAPRSIRMANKIFCVSETTRSDLERFLGRPLPHARVTYPGVTQQSLACSDILLEKGKGDAPLRLLVVGSMEPRKNVAQFLRVFLQLCKIRPGIRLDIVSGDGWGSALEGQLHNEVMSHPQIAIHQRISDAALDKLYREVDFLVFPSIYEGFGLPILEAVGKCGVIANDIPVFRELASKITGVRLIDLSQDERLSARALNETLQRGTPAHFVSADVEQMFQWNTCARRILAGMELL